MTQEAEDASCQEGGCQCGAVRYRTSGTPVRAMACHCTTCKLRTGAAYGIGVYYQENDVEFFQGRIAKYRFESDTSGRWIQNEFCSACGATVSLTLEMQPGLRAIAGGSFDNPKWYEIEAHIWARSARKDMCYPEEMLVCEEALKAP
jgi:hypothetical protein